MCIKNIKYTIKNSSIIFFIAKNKITIKKNYNKNNQKNNFLEYSF